jgi:endonuclease-3
MLKAAKIARSPKESPKALARRARAASAALRKAYAGTGTALHFRNPFELLVATILSAQCTDGKVNEVTPLLFGKYPDARALAAGKPEDVEKIVHSTGFFRQKARSIQGCARAIAERHDGRVPESMEELTALPGVGRKTANLVRACAMGQPGLIVDTHFKRVVGRLGLTAETDPDKIEFAIARLLPQSEWTEFSNALIWHGRRLCPARNPRCPQCPALAWCAFGRSEAGAA